jgi:hypothetical protein
MVHNKGIKPYAQIHRIQISVLSLSVHYHLVVLNVDIIIQLVLHSVTSVDLHLLNCIELLLFEDYKLIDY